MKRTAFLARSKQHRFRIHLLNLWVLSPNNDSLPSVEMSSHQPYRNSSVVKWRGDWVPCACPTSFLQWQTWNLDEPFSEAPADKTAKTGKQSIYRCQPSLLDLWAWSAIPYLRDYFLYVETYLIFIDMDCEASRFLLPREWVVVIDKSSFHSQGIYLDSVPRASLLNFQTTLPGTLV